MKKLTLTFLVLTLIIFSYTSCSKKTTPLQTETKQLELQPGDSDGQDCLVAFRETDNDLYATSNHSANPDVTAIRWTYNADNAGEGTNRTYIKFTGLSAIPSTAEILSANCHCTELKPE